MNPEIFRIERDEPFDGPSPKGRPRRVFDLAADGLDRSDSRFVIMGGNSALDRRGRWYTVVSDRSTGAKPFLVVEPADPPKQI